MVLLEILAFSQFKKFKKNPRVKRFGQLLKQIDPDETLRKLREQKQRRKL